MTVPLSVAIWYNLPSGGAKRALSQQVASLVGRGHRVKVWSPSTADHRFLDLSHLTEERILTLAPSPASRLDKLGRATVRWQRALDDMTKLCGRAVVEMKAEGFEVLLAHSCQHTVVPPIARLWGGPAALYLQEPNRGLYEARGEMKWVGLRPRSAWPLSLSAVSAWREFARIGATAAHEREEAARFRRVLVNSYFSREAIIRCYGLDATVCYLGIDCRLFRPLSLAREDFVLGVGAAEPHKGIDLALRAVAALPSDLPRRLHWVANKSLPEHCDELHQLARNLGVQFELHHRIGDQELVQLLNRAAVFVHTGVLEPFGYAPLEAMACGTAVVAVGEGGVREYIDDGLNGLLVGQRNPSAVSRALARILQSPDLGARLGAAGHRKAIDEWTIERAGDRLEQNLRQVVTGD